MSCQSQPTGGRRRSRKMRGGNGYGVGSPISVGALEYVPNMTSVPNGAPYKPTGGRRRSRRRGGADPKWDSYATAPLDPDMVTKSQCPEPYVFVKSIRNDAGVMMGYCRAEGDWQITTKLNKHKGGRRTRRKHRGRRRSMRGGGSVAGVGYGFTGSGERGMANQSPYPSNLPPSGAFAIPTGTR